MYEKPKRSLTSEIVFIQFTQLFSDMKRTFLFLHDKSVTNKVKSVSVNEGDSVTLHTEIELKNDDHILWLFTRENILLAQFYKLANITALYDDVFDGRLKGRLNLNHQTGSLTITNVTAELTGLYQLEIINSRKPSYKRFNVTVHAYLLVPVISSPQCTSSERLSSSNCSVLCSVMNVTHVSLSWYKGKSLLSSISVSDLNIRLSLPLDVEYQDTGTYRCVVTNSSRNQTQRLNITDICQPCSVKQSGVSEQDQISRLTIVICVFVVGALLFVTAVVIFCIYRKFGKTDQHDQSFGEEHIRLNGVCGVNETKTTTDGVKYVTVKAGESFKLDTGVTDIQKCYLIQWKFGEAGESTNPFILISRIDENKEELLQKDRLKLNKKTGSITVENSRTTDAGVYKLEIKSSTYYIIKSFFVTVNE